MCSGLNVGNTQQYFQYAHIVERFSQKVEIFRWHAHLEMTMAMTRAPLDSNVYPH